MNLKIDDNQSAKLFCGPAVVAALTGISAKLATELCAAIQQRPIGPADEDGVVWWWTISKILFAFGWRLGIRDEATGRPISSLTGRNLVIIDVNEAMSHYIVVENGYMVDNHNQTPTLIHPKKDVPVRHAWVITPLDHAEPVPYLRFRGGPEIEYYI